MEILIRLAAKLEHDRIMAFYESLSTSGQEIVFVFSSSDLKDPEESPSLENLGVTKYLTSLVHGVIFTQPDGSKLELYHR